MGFTEVAPPSTPLPAGVELRSPQPGDMDWVVQQHGDIYAREQGWDSGFQVMVAGIAADMAARHDPAWERGWIAVRHGERVGSVFVVRKSDTEAQLRLLILTPEARGMGLGGRLADECIAFARSKGYRTLLLWTHRNLVAARAIYAKRGFQRMSSEAHHSHGVDRDGEHWALSL